MAAVPVAIQCIVYPKNKTVAPYPATIVGIQYNPTLEVGGGPIIPPEEVPPDIKPDPPLTIWGGPFDPPHAAHPIVIPLPPEKPPAVPEKPHEGWNFSQAKGGWYYLYVPDPGQAQPKK